MCAKSIPFFLLFCINIHNKIVNKHLKELQQETKINEKNGAEDWDFEIEGNVNVRYPIISLQLVLNK